ncbi:DUF4407 domain-containing protein [Persicobacter psychrovividus]|uniref:DUF4407 domain-containing protein n=1 Tax=Persicobacter psychrovividus TaxID=387638 RepID=A0ABN6LFW2_9BACT|nr:hypothetical protein PEPS_28930 [Persicobacter psychrovividus]
MRKKDRFLQFSCFLCSINYEVINSCSELSKSKIKKIGSALMLVSILWFFIGFSFYQTYINESSLIGPIVSGALMVLMVTWIERQLVLKVVDNKWVKMPRIIMALCMALVGAVLIDQKLFQEDIELERETYITKRADEVYDSRSLIIKSEVQELDSLLGKYRADLDVVNRKFEKNPNTKNYKYVNVPHTVKVAGPNNTERDSIYYERRLSESNTTINQGLYNSIENLKKIIGEKEEAKTKKLAELTSMRDDIRQKLMERKGLLDELNIMVKVLSDSVVAMIFWLIWFVLVLMIELLVLFATSGQTDYDSKLQAQKEQMIRNLREEVVTDDLIYTKQQHQD